MRGEPGISLMRNPWALLRLSRRRSPHHRPHTMQPMPRMRLRKTHNMHQPCYLRDDDGIIVLSSVPAIDGPRCWVSNTVRDAVAHVYFSVQYRRAGKELRIISYLKTASSRVV